MLKFSSPESIYEAYAIYEYSKLILAKGHNKEAL
jgi:hypothetical protein